MYDICCIGHITSDKVVTPEKTVFLPGGTSVYFSNAIAKMDVRYALVTALAGKELRFVKDLSDKGIEVKNFPSEHTVYFENIYSGNRDHRVQKVPQKADPFTLQEVDHIDAAIFHLGSLLADDFSPDMIRALSQKADVSLDVQGFLRKVENKNVIPCDWKEKKDALPYITILKANEAELETLTNESDIHKGAKLLHDWGVKEVVITLGSKGSVVYHDDIFYNIPAYKPHVINDATGCGDTYMAGYLYYRFKKKSVRQAGEFAAAMASLKIETFGPLYKTEDEILNSLELFEKSE